MLIPCFLVPKPAAMLHLINHLAELDRSRAQVFSVRGVRKMTDAGDRESSLSDRRGVCCLRDAFTNIAAFRRVFRRLHTFRRCWW